MINTIYGIKDNQTQKFLENGTRIPVTEVIIKGQTIVSIKTSDKHGYNALQLTVGGDRKKANKALLGQVRGAKLEKAPRFLREAKVIGDNQYQVGETIKVTDVLKPGDLVDVRGVSKGKGFAGGVKRHHFKGGPKTHGQSDRLRAPGSIGQTTTPGRVYKGKRMAGKMGFETATVKNLEVVDVTDGKVSLKGLIPGSLNSLVEITKIGEKKKFVPMIKPSSANASEGQEEEVSKEGEVPSVRQAQDENVSKGEKEEPEAKIEAKEAVKEPEVKEEKVEASSASSEQAVEEVKAEDPKEEAKTDEVKEEENG